MIRATLIAAALTALAASLAHAQESALKDRVDVGFHDPDLSAARFAGADLGEWHPSRSLLWRGRTITPADAPAGAVGFLTLRAETLYGLERVQLTPLEMALEGAATGATLGLFAGAVGGATGLWSERTSWTIVGGLAAFGAIMGAKKGIDEPAVRLRFRDER
jgi:hypothetical protein